MLIGSTLLTVSYCTMSMVLISHYSQPSSVNSTYLHTNTPPQSPRICEIAKDIRGRNERIDFTLFFPTQGSLSNIFRAPRNSTLGSIRTKKLHCEQLSKMVLYHLHVHSFRGCTVPLPQIFSSNPPPPHQPSSTYHIPSRATDT